MAPSKKCKDHKKPNNKPSLKNSFFTNRTSKAKERMKKLRATENELTRTERRNANAIRMSQQRNKEDETERTERRNADAI